VVREGVENPLLEAVSAWGAWVLEEARKELSSSIRTIPTYLRRDAGNSSFAF
jgi:hypothetical protein